RHQRLEVGTADGVLGQQHEAGRVVDRSDEIQQVPADGAVDAGLAEQRLGQHGVAAARRQDKGAQSTTGDWRAHSALASGMPSSLRISGTPRSTPWKPVRGSPTCTPLSIQNSRIVASCFPVRFLTIEMARFTAPRASKKRSMITESAR